jgi:aminoglycoside phosphotransferase (APT) family kinase protein
VHPGQLTVTVETVRSLVAQQFPSWRDEPVHAVKAAGTVHSIFRIGPRLCARFPLRVTEPAETRRVLEVEAAAARELLGITRFATPEPIAIGEPGFGYPGPWSVQTWLAGVPAAKADPGESVAFAHDIAEFIHAVRAIDTRGRSFEGRGRGGDLRSHDEWMQTCFAHSENVLDVSRLRRLWSSLRDLPRSSVDDVMSHGDLMPGNVLVSGNRLVGIIDVGGLGPADPALDLVAAWHLLESGPRQALRADLGCDDLEWARGMAWAFEQALGLIWYYLRSSPSMSELGRRTLNRIMTEQSP